MNAGGFFIYFYIFAVSLGFLIGYFSGATMAKMSRFKFKIDIDEKEDEKED